MQSEHIHTAASDFHVIETDPRFFCVNSYCNFVFTTNASLGIWQKFHVYSSFSPPFVEWKVIVQFPVMGCNSK